jgi:hypothetical protein
LYTASKHITHYASWFMGVRGVMNEAAKWAELEVYAMGTSNERAPKVRIVASKKLMQDRKGEGGAAKVPPKSARQCVKATHDGACVGKWGW